MVVETRFMIAGLGNPAERGKASEKSNSERFIDENENFDDSILLNPKQEHELYVFPNPSKGKVFALTTDTNSKFTLLDTQGKEVSLSKNKLSDNLVELTCICENGLYQLIIIENEKITVKKIEFFK
jgi:hypothetical protein